MTKTEPGYDRNERNTAALVGFALSLIVVVPLLPLVGAIIAATRIPKARRMKAEGNPLHGLGYAVAGTAFGFGFTLLLAVGAIVAGATIHY